MSVSITICQTVWKTMYKKLVEQAEIRKKVQLIFYKLLLKLSSLSCIKATVIISN